MNERTATGRMPEREEELLDEMATLRREIQALRRENRILQMANAELERVADRDTLTTIYSRRYFLNALGDRLKRLERYQARAVLVFVDVNGMKRINDTHGHLAGDFALVHIAAILASNIRDTDIVARIGGDEFAIILDEISQVEAQCKIDALSAALAESLCDYSGNPLPVAASFGLTALAPGDREEEVLARADAAMYAAKATGDTDQRSDK